VFEARRGTCDLWLSMDVGSRCWRREFPRAVFDLETERNPLLFWLRPCLELREINSIWDLGYLRLGVLSPLLDDASRPLLVVGDLRTSVDADF
jgi:hypothetical protein